MCNTWIEKIDEQIAFPSQINAVIDQIKWQNHWFDAVKIWPAFREPSNVIFYNPQIKHYIKAYVHNKVWKEAYFTEITNINMFNEFCDRIVGKFSWPTILKQDDENLYFVMKDIESQGFSKIDFSKLALDDLLKIYSEYRSTFDEFEKNNEKLQWSSNKIRVSTWDKIFKILSDWTNPVAKIAYFCGQKNKIKERYHEWEQYVHSFLQTNFEQLKAKLKELQNDVEKAELEFVYNRLWTGHVFSDWTHHKLIDFDSLWYRIKWTETVALMWTNTLLSVEKYQTYEEWKHSAMKWRDLIEKECWNQNLWKLLIFQKLIGTMYLDYPKWEKVKEVSATEYELRRKRWILWLGKLLHERYGIPYLETMQEIWL